jgi:hypothetical protein
MTTAVHVPTPPAVAPAHVPWSQGHIVVGKGSLSLDNAGCGFVSEGGVKAAVSRLVSAAAPMLLHTKDVVEK